MPTRALPRPAVEVEGSLRTWLRTTPVVGARWYFGAPLTPTFPLGLLAVPSIVPIPGGVLPIRQATAQLDLWGEKARDRYDLGGLANELVTIIDSLPSGTEMGPAVCLGATVISGPRFQPDPDDGKARYVLVAEFTMRPGTAVDEGSGPGLEFVESGI